MPVSPVSTNDTIFAVATGAGRTAISVIRVSGPRSAAIAKALAGRVPPPRRAALVRLRDPGTDETLDHCLLLFFEAAKSELGEDGAEFHLHGSPAVVGAVLGVLARQPGLRQAEPGEFTRRAFLNGKLDLAQVEGLADLIDAETDWQRRQAQRQLSGAMRDATAPWRAALVAAAAQVETAIDFAEDVALEASVHDEVVALIAPIRAGLRRELAQGHAAERIREGVQIVIAGPPNAGKSTLLNALVRREAAIVSAIAGTTRDPIEVHLDLGGCPVTLIDTAGLRESGDAVEQIGMFRARERADAADLVLWLAEDAADPPAFSAPVWKIQTKVDAAHPRLRSGRGGPPQAMAGAGPPSERMPCRPVSEKGAAAPSTILRMVRGGEDAPMPISAKSGENLDRLVENLEEFAQKLAGTGASGLLARARHRQAFAAASAALDHLVDNLDLPVEVMAEDLRTARFALDRLIGRVDVEDILGEVFSRFCIGK